MKTSSMLQNSLSCQGLFNGEKLGKSAIAELEILDSLDLLHESNKNLN